MIRQQIRNWKGEGIGFIVCGLTITQVHSTGLTITEDRDDLQTENETLCEFIARAKSNALPSQQTSGVRW